MAKPYLYIVFLTKVDDEKMQETRRKERFEKTRQTISIASIASQIRLYVDTYI